MPSRGTGEREWLTGALFVLETRTLVVDEPSDLVERSLRQKLEDLHENYRGVAGLDGSATFAELAQAAQTRAVPAHEAARVLRYANRLDAVVARVEARPVDGLIAFDERRLEPADAALINRAWEQALDRIDLTTTIRLQSGDISSRLGCQEGHPPGPIVAFHGEMTNLGIACWHELIGLVLQLEQHQRQIAAWFARLNRDWTRLRLGLSTSALALTGWFVYRDVAAFSVVSLWDVVQTLSPLYPLALRELIRVAARRLVLNAAEGPRALLPAT